MEPWIQHTTAPQQPDLATDERALEVPFEVERGWMEAQSPPIETRRESFGIIVLAASVAIGFVLAMVVLAPLMLRWLAS